MQGELISPLSKDSLDIESIKQIIQDDLKQNTSITDVEFEGAQISMFIQIMAYSILSINATHALTYNETMLLLSDIRQNILYSAQAQSYNITRKQSSKMNIKIDITQLSNELDTYIIPKWGEFNCGDYKFYNKEPITFSDSVLSNTVEIIEGTFITDKDDSNLLINLTENTSKFTIGYKDIENDNLFIQVKKSGEVEFSDYLNVVDSLLLLKNDEKNIHVKTNPVTEFVEVYTNFAGQGLNLESGDSVKISFILSSGIEANGTVSCEYNGNELSQAGEIVDLTLEVVNPSSSGTDEESNESIKENAPVFYNSGNRMVNTNDHNSILEKNSLVLKANSWGGETEFPENLGNIYLSCVPQDSNSNYLTDLERVDILEYISDKHFPAVNYLFRKPKYIEVDIDVQILGNVTDIASKKEQIETQITQYFTKNVRKYKSKFFEAKVITVIEDLFTQLPDTSVKVTLRPKIVVRDGMIDDNIITISDNTPFIINVPASSQRYYLVKNGQKIDIPKDNVGINNYFIDGWVKELAPDNDILIDLSGTINSKVLTMDDVETTETIGGVSKQANIIKLDGVLIGYYVHELGEIRITNNDFRNDLTSTDEYIIIEYQDKINVQTLKDSIFELGNINYI